eukprot:451605-Hanusia_phi.AAC.1
MKKLSQVLQGLEGDKTKSLLQAADGWRSLVEEEEDKVLDAKKAEGEALEARKEGEAAEAAVHHLFVDLENQEEQREERIIDISPIFLNTSDVEVYLRRRDQASHSFLEGRRREEEEEGENSFLEGGRRKEEEGENSLLEGRRRKEEEGENTFLEGRRREEEENRDSRRQEKEVETKSAKVDEGTRNERRSINDFSVKRSVTSYLSRKEVFDAYCAKGGGRKRMAWSEFAKILQAAGIVGEEERRDELMMKEEEVRKTFRLFAVGKRTRERKAQVASGEIMGVREKERRGNDVGQEQEQEHETLDLHGYKKAIEIIASQYSSLLFLRKRNPMISRYASSLPPPHSPAPSTFLP